MVVGDEEVSASSDILPSKEFFFNLFGFHIIDGGPRINLLFVGEIKGKSSVHPGGRQMLVLADDIFRAMAEVVQ